MLAKGLQRTVQRQCFDGSALSACSRGPKKRIVDCFFSGFDDGEKEWRGGVVPQGLERTRCDGLAWIARFDTDVRGSREGDSIVTTAVAG
jgi:hypothetical protein